MRPLAVLAHNVPVSEGVRERKETVPPVRRRLPRRCQSPHLPEFVNGPSSLQLAAKKVWNRFVGLLASNPERPPSPPMLSSQVSTDPSNWKVPLSCVPPWSSPCGFCGLIDRLWNCSVRRPELRLKIAVGTADKS